MSVVVWDGKVMAADRQGTLDHGHRQKNTKIWRVQRPQKIDDEVFYESAVIAITGGLGTGLVMYDWWMRGADISNYPKSQDDKDDWCRLIVLTKFHLVYYERHPVAIDVEGPYHAWGTGSDYAYGALAMGADARKAVEIASMFDVKCGLGVDVFERP